MQFLDFTAPVAMLALGRTYRNGLGQQVDIVAKTDDEEFNFEASDGMCYSADGRFEQGGEAVMNLVAEVQTVKNPSFDPVPDEDEITIIVRAARPSANLNAELTELFGRLVNNPIVKSVSY